jgi:catechol 2,3-dioxygenase-like lactoylglutathione lyase family enzyme
MPKSIFHTVVLTDDLDGVVRFLNEVVGIEPVRWFGDEVGSPEQTQAVLGWPVEDVSIRGAIVGQGVGMIEALEIPESLRDREQPRVAFLTLATPDVEGYAERARAAGFDVAPTTAGDGVVSTFAMAPVTVGGIPFELIRFGEVVR